MRKKLYSANVPNDEEELALEGFIEEKFKEFNAKYDDLRTIIKLPKLKKRGAIGTLSSFLKIEHEYRRNFFNEAASINKIIKSNSDEKLNYDKVTEARNKYNSLISELKYQGCDVDEHLSLYVNRYLKDSVKCLDEVIADLKKKDRERQTVKKPLTESVQTSFVESTEKRISEVKEDINRLYRALRAADNDEEENDIKAEIKANENMLEKLEADLEGQKKDIVGEEGFVDAFKRYSRWCDEIRTNLTVGKDGIKVSNNFADIRSWSNKAIKFYDKVKVSLEEMIDATDDESVIAKIKEFSTELTDLIGSINNGIGYLDKVDRGALGRTTKINPSFTILGEGGIDLEFRKESKEVVIDLPEDSLLITSGTMLSKNKRQTIKTLNELKKFVDGK